MTLSELNKRAKHILGLIVHNYIFTGKTTGSAALVKNYDVPWSSATVRSTMAELMASRYITQPHTSAGRVPTDKGVRFYIDFLLEKTKLPERSRRDIERRYAEFDGTMDEMLHETSSMLFDISHFAGLATTPVTKYMKIKSAELVKLADHTVLVVFVFEGGLTEKTLVRMAGSIKPDILMRASRYLNEVSLGFTLEEVSRKVVGQLRDERRFLKELVAKIFGEKGALSKSGRSEIYIIGRTSILESDDITDPVKLQELVWTLDEKELLVKILDDAIDGDGVRVLIGTESGVTEGCSIIAAPYGDDKRLGTLGVVGPTRMNYSTLIPLVDYTARYISKFIKEGELYK